MAHDYALELWLERQAEFLEGQTQSLELRDLVRQLLNSRGVAVQIPTLTFSQYLQYREKSGISSFNKELSTVLSKVHDQDERVRRINSATSALHADLTQTELADLCTIWQYENTPTWSYKDQNKRTVFVHDRKLVPKGVKSYQANKPNNAFRAVTHPKSQLLSILGIEPEDKCGYLDRPAKIASTRLQAAAKWALTKENSYTAMANLLFKDSGHQLETKDQNGVGQQLHECRHCRQALQDQLIRSIRGAKAIQETEEMRNLISNLRQKPRTWQVQDQDAEEDQSWFEPDLDDW